MTQVVSWTLHLSVQGGRLDSARSLMSEMVEASRSEPGCLGCDWFLSGDGGSCHVHERFEDSAAARHHLRTFGARFADRFLGCFSPTAFYVYGEPSAELRGVLSGFGASYLGTFAGVGESR